MDLPYIEKFSSCGTLEYCHWQILDGPLAQTSNDNWQISTGETWDSPLGPDLHALFRWIPVISSLDSYLVSPRLNLAGSETVTVQYDFFLDWYQDDITFGTRWGGTGTDFINESVSLNEQIYNIDVEAGLVHVTTETTDPDTQVGFHLAAASSGGIELLGLDEIRVCAGSPPLFVNVPEE